MYNVTAVAKKTLAAGSGGLLTLHNTTGSQVVAILQTPPPTQQVGVPGELRCRAQSGVGIRRATTARAACAPPVQ